MRYADECYDYDVTFRSEKLELDRAQRSSIVVAMNLHNRKEAELLLWHQQQVEELRENMFVDRHRIIDAWL